ncbi:DUF3574 domain-containing protein [Burkholderia diffusa]|uniref:DUF3574 domain-containing protein n=1 Tax=Burkholderia diffusa TaxID=488732 RepID=UPI000754286D|nr:DUF3574 domain-containing protein [Burkholderia diffusa]KUZ18304.1 hypothetical protein WI28_03790 [Burkholderia diffusa]KVC10403.1 hypothetical protein WI69_28410 [Burkholderia diffusa]KVC43814.1 hypothetical protein WI71_19715 [Burkholderia diffusa]KVH43467.1 hypothetical protein WJ39_25955 [Burkholderia diffusa]KVN06401.1 hypothetical protein WJ62_06320 [Burkholderia diffusa]
MPPSNARPATWKRRAHHAIGAAAIALLAGCAAPPSPVIDTPAACVQPDAHRMLQADLLFGRDIAGRGPVTDAERAAFLADVVTPRFPDGLTYWDTHGQWRDRATGRIIREASFVVRIVADDTADTHARLAEIRQAYRERFRQESVGITLVPACASF